jgi:hypothetical protein
VGEPRVSESAPRRRQGFWLTAGEIVGVLALIVAGLNLWDSHRQHQEDTRRAQQTAAALAAFVAVGQIERDGRSVVISPLAGGQAIQSQRFIFPQDLGESPREVTGSRPRLELDWISAGLRGALETAHRKGAGVGRTPVLIETTYVEAGDERTDRSIYRLGYSWRPRLIGGIQIRLQGLALVRRAVGGDAQRLIEAQWSADRPKPAS